MTLKGYKKHLKYGFGEGGNKMLDRKSDNVDRSAKDGRKDVFIDCSEAGTE